MTHRLQRAAGKNSLLLSSLWIFTNKALSISFFSRRPACQYSFNAAITFFDLTLRSLRNASKFRKSWHLSLKLTVISWQRWNTLWFVCLRALSHGFFHVSHDRFDSLTCCVDLFTDLSIGSPGWHPHWTYCSLLEITSPHKGTWPIAKVTLVILPLLRRVSPPSHSVLFELPPPWFCLFLSFPCIMRVPIIPPRWVGRSSKLGKYMIRNTNSIRQVCMEPPCALSHT